MQNYLSIKNLDTIDFSEIPLLDYDRFLETNISLLDEPAGHCAAYYGYPLNGVIRLICCVADDAAGLIRVSSSGIEPGGTYQSFTAYKYAFHNFEREIAENFGIKYHGHPWLKPLRYAFDRYDRNQVMDNYPFYSIKSEELHEVGVGPVHAGVIEPGHFRFICKGEQIQHLEIQLGYQHRGVERLFLEADSMLKRTILAEQIAGDTTAGHTAAFANLWESLCGVETGGHLGFSRALAMELERIAIHTGDLSAICGDIAYQLGNAVFGRLRTPVINFMQSWCGNRLGRGLIRPGYTNFPFTEALRDSLLVMLDKYRPDFEEMIDRFFHDPGSLSRLEKTGVVTAAQASAIGAVGMAAKASGLSRDIRSSHPFHAYENHKLQPVVKHHGDVYSRTQIRREEILQSMEFIKNLTLNIPECPEADRVELQPRPSSFTVSMAEGWRGEICHCAITDGDGRLVHYKIKDPSYHNWLALALAVRKNEISDFPICNKSFNLSYCGFDL